VIVDEGEKKKLEELKKKKSEELDEDEKNFLEAAQDIRPCHFFWKSTWKSAGCHKGGSCKMCHCTKHADFAKKARPCKQKRMLAKMYEAPEHDMAPRLGARLHKKELFSAPAAVAFQEKELDMKTFSVTEHRVDFLATPEATALAAPMQLPGSSWLPCNPFPLPMMTMILQPVLM